MQIARYGVILRPLKKRDLELVRKWRNQSFVRDNMRIQHVISKPAQHQWYARLRQTDALYWIMETPITKDPYGLIHIGTSRLESPYYREVGIFVGSPHFKGSFLVWLASYSMLRFAFDDLRLAGCTAWVATHNQNAQAYNASLGFTRMPRQNPKARFHKYVLTLSAFEAATAQFKSFIGRLSSSNNHPGSDVSRPAKHTQFAL